MAAVTLLETRGLSKSFGGVTACDGIDLALSAGETLALIGPNGSGKSTFTAMVSGRIRPDRGRVLLRGRDVTALPAHARIAMGMAYTFQITSVFADLPVRENVALALRRTVRGEGRVQAGTDRTLERVGLLARADQPAGDLSYGHQRVLEIAMGLAQNPALFILDEPTQGLSEPEVAEFVALMDALPAATAVLLVEHNMDVVMRLAGRIAVLDAGGLIAVGPPDRIRADPAVQAAYLGTADA